MALTLDSLDASQLRQIDQGGKLWHLYRKAFVDSLFFASKAVLASIPPDQNLMTERCHLPLCLTLEEVNHGRIRRLLVEMSRKHLKSTLCTVHRPIHKLGMRILAGQDPSDRFGIVSYKFELAQRFWGEIKLIFERNHLFRHLWPELLPRLGLDKWNESKGTVPREWQPKEPTFDCFAKGTGHAYDDVTEDDPINEENYDSPTAVEKAIEQHRLIEHLIDPGSAKRGVIVTVGNPWGLSDVSSEVHKEEPGTAIYSVGCFGARIEENYSRTRRLSRGLPESVVELLRKLPRGEPVWPEKFDRDELARILTKVKPRIFSAQWLCDPTDDDSVDFKSDWLRSCDLRIIEGEPHILYEDDPEPVSLSRLNVYITWDPALDGKSSQSRNAVLVSGIDSDGRVAVIKDYAKKQDPRDTIEVFLALAKLYQPWLKAAGVEEVVFSQVLGKLLQDKAKEAGIFLNYKPLKVPRGMGKDQRIRAWCGTMFEDRRVYVRKGCLNFTEEYLHFGVPGATRDLMDAFAHATRLFKRPMSAERILRMERSKERIEQDRGITGYGTTLA